MKYFYKVDEDGKQSRAPHGARGLKFIHGLSVEIDLQVAPRTGRVD